MENNSTFLKNKTYIRTDDDNNNSRKRIQLSVKELDKLPKEIWNNPFCFFDSPFLEEAMNFDALNRILMHYMPYTIEPSFKKRKKFKKEDIIRDSHQHGIHFVYEKKVGIKPDYIILEFRLQEVTPEKDSLDKEAYKNVKEDISTTDPGEMMALVEDRVRFNILMIPDEGELFIIGCVFYNC